MFNHASGQLLPGYPSTRGIPTAHRTLHGLMFNKTSGHLLREHTRNPRHLDLHPQTRRREMFMRQHCCACTPQAHLDLSPCAKRQVPAKRLAFSRREHSWISLRAQEDLFMRQHCCIRTLSAHLDLTPCAKRHVPAKSFVRKEACSIEKTAAIWRCPSLTLSVTRDRNPGHRAFAFQIVDPISVYAVGETSGDAHVQASMYMVATYTYVYTCTHGHVCIYTYVLLNGT